MNGDKLSENVRSETEGHQKFVRIHTSLLQLIDTPTIILLLFEKCQFVIFRLKSKEKEDLITNIGKFDQLRNKT